MEDYKITNIQKYLRTNERNKFINHPSKIISKETFLRHCAKLAAPHDRILDVGGGAGVYTALLQGEGIPVKIFAVDISRSMLCERSTGDSKIVGDMERLPFGDASFDRVFFFSAIHHVADTKRTLEEAKRVLRKGGALVLNEPISLRMLFSGKTIEPLPTDHSEFRFSIRYLLKLLDILGLNVTYVYYQGLSRRFLPVKRNVMVRRFLDKIDYIFNHVPLVRNLGVLGNKVTIVAQKI